VLLGVEIGHHPNEELLHENTFEVIFLLILLFDEILGNKDDFGDRLIGELIRSLVEQFHKVIENLDKFVDFIVSLGNESAIG